MSAIVAGAIALAGVTGCGSTQGASSTGGPTGTLSGDVTFASASGHALVRVFSSRGQLLKHQGVTTAHGQFQFTLPAGQYQVILKLQAGLLVKAGSSAGCAAESASVRAGHTTHVAIGRTCSTS